MSSRNAIFSNLELLLNYYLTPKLIVLLFIVVKILGSLSGALRSRNAGKARSRSGRLRL